MCQNIMFVAKFTQTSGAPFVADKNGNFTFIGTVMTGTATGTIINGTMFQRDGLKPNTLYACENSIDPEYPDNVQVDVVSEVPLLEYMQLRTILGAPQVKRGDVKADSKQEDATI
jgi:hypothetical protein